MAGSHVVSALVAKRGQLVREIDAAERYLRRLEANLTHVDGVLRLYQAPDGGVEPDAIPYGLVPRRIRWFRSGELPRLALDVLREAGAAGLSAPEITARVMAAKGMDPDDAECRVLVRKGVNGCLLRRRRGGLILAVPGADGADGAGGVRWRVAT